MDLRIVTVPLDGGSNPTGTALHELQQEHEITRYDHYLVELGGGPAIAVVAVVRPREGSGSEPSRRDRRRTKLEAVLASLDDPQRHRFEDLRSWRRLAAEEGGMPVYAVATNRQLADIARLDAPSLSALGRVPGFGKRRVERYGEAILQIVRRSRATGSGPSEAKPAEGEPHDR